MTHRKLIATSAAFAVVLLAMAVVLLVAVDKPHVGWLVGWGFLPTISVGVIIGGVVMLVLTALSPVRTTWRGVTLILWALIAITSPLFGFLILLPWGVLVVSALLVAWILRDLFAAARARG